MKTLIMILAVTIGVAKADAFKKTVLKLSCEKKIDLTSDGKLASIYVDDELVNQNKSVYAGTEGGDVYMQFVGGGYNITLSGEEFSKAFFSDSTKFTKISVKANVNKYDESKYFSVNCTGEIKFLNQN